MYPDIFLCRIKKQLGDENSFESFMKAIDKEPFKALRINTLKTSPEEFVRNNPFGITKEDTVPWCREGLYYSSEVAPGKHPLHFAGVYYVQEPSAMSVVGNLDVRPGQKVLDLCAAPGGKSTQIAALLKGEGLLVANEPILKRADILSENVERLGIGNSLVVSADPAALSRRFESFFDRILVDAPCSGEGMFRKNELATQEWSPENVLMCQSRQRDILKEAVVMLKAGGRMVYSTCTFSEEENERNVEWMLENFPDMSLVEMKRLWPHEIKGEGHFYAVFEKSGNMSENKGRQIKGVSQKQIIRFEEFQKENLNINIEEMSSFAGGCYVMFGEELHLLPSQIPLIDALKVLRAGLHLGTLKKDRFEPSFALSHFLSEQMVKRSVSLSEEDALRYLKGETLNIEGEKGYYLVTVDGFALGWGKLSGGIMKNHYPKGLRIKC